LTAILILIVAQQPADAYFGRAKAVPAERARIKSITTGHRRLQHRKLAA